MTLDFVRCPVCDGGASRIKDTYMYYCTNPKCKHRWYSPCSQDPDAETGCRMSFKSISYSYLCKECGKPTTLSKCPECGSSNLKRDYVIGYLYTCKKCGQQQQVNY